MTAPNPEYVRVRDAMLRVFLDATDDLPDDAADGIDALLADRALLREAAQIDDGSRETP